MRINETYGRFNGPTVDATRQGKGAANAPKTDGGDTTSSATSGTDAVTLSSKAQELSQAAAENSDNARVEQLRGAIQGGTFQIDRQAIANRIVDGG
jgi:flagellar biosynthesis anti-sigma factor FlgM